MDGVAFCTALHRTDETRVRSRRSWIYAFDYRTILNNALVSAVHTLLSNLYTTELEALVSITNTNCCVRTTHTKDDLGRVHVITSVSPLYERHPDFADCPLRVGGCPAKQG